MIASVHQRLLVSRLENQTVNVCWLQECWSPALESFCSKRVEPSPVRTPTSAPAAAAAGLGLNWEPHALWISTEFLLFLSAAQQMRF